MSKHPEFVIWENGNLEPLFSPNEHVLEECLRREADRLSHQDALMNRVVYDCIDPSPHYAEKQTDMDIDVKIDFK